MKINSVPQPNAHRPETHEPPAKAARAALKDRPDLADQPFGRLVSLFARGEPLPAAKTPPADPSS